MKLFLRYVFILTLLVGFVSTACTEKVPKPDLAEGVKHPEWSKNANIYEVNIRQYSEEGTFDAFRKDLPRLETMGVKILWLMPIHPIGEKNRKGTLGSYYSVKDYKGINPNYGTEKDLQLLVDEAHELGMKMIIDWVANHTAWGNPWTKNPDWYEHDKDGNFTPPHGTDWTDVIQLNYKSDDMRAAMIDAMEYWVRDFGIDGFRCDVAGMVPIDFWIDARTSLDKIKPVFMLAEDESPEMHKAFDMTYAWTYAHIIREIAKGNEGFGTLDSLFEVDKTRFNTSDYRMYFTSNHDENSWNGTDPEMYGANFENFAVLSATIDDMPLIYDGQESGLDKRLEFFEKDEIEWKEYKYEPLYTLLLKLNTENKALWNGQYGGDLTVYEKSANTFSYRRQKDNDWVFVYLNNSDKDIHVPLSEYDIPNKVESYQIYSGQLPPDKSNTMKVEANSWLLIANK